MKILIKGARVIDPANNTDDVRDILIDGANERAYQLSQALLFCLSHL